MASIDKEGGREREREVLTAAMRARDKKSFSFLQAMDLLRERKLLVLVCCIGGGELVDSGVLITVSS
jgi:hypothetical protein